MSAPIDPKEWQEFCDALLTVLGVTLEELEEIKARHYSGSRSHPKTVLIPLKFPLPVVLGMQVEIKEDPGLIETTSAGSRIVHLRRKK